MIVAPGSRASSLVAISAVSTEGETTSPRSSTTKQRSASPSKASPMSARCSVTARCRSRRFSGSMGLASWFGNVPSRVEVERDQRDRQPLEDLRHGMARHPVAGVHRHRERPDRGDVDQLPQVVGVPGEQVPPGDGAGRRGGAKVRSARSLMSLQAGLDADRLGSGAAQLDAVVPGRVVAGRDHRAGDAEVAAGVVEHVGRAQAAGHHVGSLRRRAAAERVRQRARGGAHVVHGHDRPGAGQPGERRADRLRHALVELVGHDPSDVVRLDDARKITQCGTCPPARDRCRPPGADGTAEPIGPAAALSAVPAGGPGG